MIKRYDIHEDEEFGTTREYSDTGCHVDADDYAALQASHDRLLAALKLFNARVLFHGDWDEGCFYYFGKSAAELQEPLNRAGAAISAAQPFTET